MKERILTAKKCWQIKGCPAGFYHNCRAYEKQVNCWSIKDGCMCLSDEHCDRCSIYRDYTKQVSTEVKESRN